MSPKLNKRAIFVCILLVILAGVLVAFSRAKAKANLFVASSRLSQMRLALEMYEDDHGTLPPLVLRGSDGIPTQSWRALISRYLGVGKQLEQLDLSQPWNSNHNRRIADNVPHDDWGWFALDRSQITEPVSTHILAYVGRESIWYPGTGLPKGKTPEHPNAISLIWIPKGSLHPLQPGDITEEEVRELVTSGKVVLFIKARASFGWGVVKIEQGELAFHTWQEELDRREGQH